ncbi:MAG: cadmium-translocating P-type ATPase, partial [Oscillospiraceae bacterium]|nr:cadmium-translocating P-type ATPase [Oscillospiraceae bacterium]
MTTKQKKMLLRIIIAAVIFAGGITASALLPEAFSYAWVVELIVFGAAYILPGWDVIWKALRNIAHGQVFDENFLMTIASVGAMVIGDFDEGAAVMLFYRVGDLFESVAVGRSRRSIAEMVDINPEYANVERSGEITEVEPDEVEVGEIIVIRPGERVPLDGVVTSGCSGLNTAALTGESALREVAEGDEVISGCINTSGLIKVRVSRPYSDSTVARILELVENSSENKAKTENFITRFARVYTPIVVIGALLLAIIPPLFFLAVGTDPDWSGWVYRALTFLVVSCPCALVISVPLSYFGGIGGASKHGIMIKGANYLEALTKAQIFVFDKTGTLTKGSFTVTEIHPQNISENELLAYCATAEGFSTHPIALSVARAGSDLSVPTAENAEELAGLGVRATIDGKTVCVGNERLMKQCGASSTTPESTGTAVHCAIDGVYAGYLIISDEVKEGASQAISAIRKRCGAKTVMLTGDRKLTGEAVAKQLCLDEWHT